MHCSLIDAALLKHARVGSRLRTDRPQRDNPEQIELRQNIND